MRLAAIYHTTGQYTQPSTHTYNDFNVIIKYKHEKRIKSITYFLECVRSHRKSQKQHKWISSAYIDLFRNSICIRKRKEKNSQTSYTSLHIFVCVCVLFEQVNQLLRLHDIMCTRIYYNVNRMCGSLNCIEVLIVSEKVQKFEAKRKFAFANVGDIVRYGLCVLEDLTHCCRMGEHNVRVRKCVMKSTLSDLLHFLSFHHVKHSIGIL